MSIENFELEDARTLAALWLNYDEETRRKMWTSDLKKIMEQFLNATDPDRRVSPQAQGAGKRLDSLTSHELATSIGSGYAEGSMAEKLWYQRAYNALEIAFEGGLRQAALTSAQERDTSAEEHLDECMKLFCRLVGNCKDDLLHAKTIQDYDKFWTRVNERRAAFASADRAAKEKTQ